MLAILQRDADLGVWENEGGRAVQPPSDSARTRHDHSECSSSSPNRREFMNPISPVLGADDLHPELKQYGIARFTTEHFEVGGYRYSRLEDAVAEAKRRFLSTGNGS